MRVTAGDRCGTRVADASAMNMWTLTAHGRQLLLARRPAMLAIAVVIFTAAAADADSTSTRLAQAIQQIEVLPYQPDYVPVGFDSAFAPALVPNTAAAQDYTTGSIPGSPDAPAWPMAFQPVTLDSADGARLTGMLALHGGRHPGVVVVHGFNTHGNLSVIRWAALLYANGYNVFAADQRDFSAEYSAGYGYPSFPQAFGWKESGDVVAAGRFLARQPGVTSVGVSGFSEGAQNTVLALAQTGTTVFAAGLTFSGPADQNAQIYSTAEPAGCETPNCSYPVTGALINLVVPPYTFIDPCTALPYAGTYYAVDPFDILAALPRGDDGGLRERRTADTDGRAGCARVLLRSLVAAAGDVALLQGDAPWRSVRSLDRHEPDRQPDARRRSALHTDRESRSAHARASRSVSRTVRV